MGGRTSKENRKTQGAKAFKEIMKCQDKKIKCHVCGLNFENSDLYRKHLSSQMHKAFSMVIDLT